MRTVYLLLLAAVLAVQTGCAGQSTEPPAPPAATAATLASSATPPAVVVPTITAPAATPSPQPAAPSPTSAPRPSPTHPAIPTPPAGMTITDDGHTQVLNSARFYWHMQLPHGWIITTNNGFEIDAAEPANKAFVHLLAQTWLMAERKPDAQAYIDYWKHFKYGDLFPVFVQGTLQGQTRISPDKYGGPFLRFEFLDSKKGMRYVQVYASGGGPSSLVATVWAGVADYPALSGMLEGIINSAELLKEP